MDVREIGPGDRSTFPVESRPELFPRGGAIFLHLAQRLPPQFRCERAIAGAGISAANPWLIRTTLWCAQSWISRRPSRSRAIVFCARLLAELNEPAAASSSTISGWSGLVVLVEARLAPVLLPMRMHSGVQLSGTFKSVEKNRRRQAEIA